MQNVCPLYMLVSIRKQWTICPRVDVVPNLRFIFGGFRSPSFDNSTYRVVNVPGGF